jgi:diguanylate cyclase (GGDEF)-like protein/PAS domain S-box-containing protein
MPDQSRARLPPSSLLDDGAPEWTDQHECAKEIDTARLDLLYEQAPISLTATVINALLLALGLWDVVPKEAIAFWLSAVMAVCLLRIHLLWRYRAADRAAGGIGVARSRYLAGASANGALWGIAGVCFFVPDSYAHQTLLAFVLAGMSAGAVATLSTVRGASLFFLIPALLPYTVRVVVDGTLIHIIMGGMVVLFVAMLSLISDRLQSNVSQSLQLRFENTRLLANLRRAKQRQDTVNRALSAEVAAKQRAQIALHASHRDLEVRVDQRTRELAESNDRLATEKELFRITLASIVDGVITTDREGHITYLNPAAESFTGWCAAEAEGLPLAKVFCVAQADGSLPDAELAGGDVASQGHLVLTDSLGQALDIHHTAAPICDQQGQRVGTVLTFRDMSEERRLARQLSHQAMHDALTGLVNRREFDRRLDLLLRSGDLRQPHALLFLDLDQFKLVNDTCGHLAGDELLRQISTLMRTRIRAQDTFARLGGDEFAVLLEFCPRVEALRVAQTLLELVQGFRFGWRDLSFGVGVSIGLVEISDGWSDSAALLRAADSACYTAKDRGRNRICIYEPDDLGFQRRFGQVQWMPRIQHAIADGRMRLYLQPIVPTRPTEEGPELAEVLIRLVEEDGSIVLPGAFLPAAERYGQMNTIDRWVVSETFDLLAKRKGEQRDTVLSVNLSGQSLSDEGFLDFVLDQLGESGVQGSNVCFEITETAAISDLQRALAFITTLRGCGCRFSLDDFGSGLSSFGYLKTLPVDYLKIDGRFVRELVHDRVDEAMVESIQRLGHVMGVETIAEWVEDAATLDRLAAMNVDYVQGFHLGPPRPM